ncbi:Galactokinase [Corynebacterium caspium DSM 44850]|nr:Galactokinase [Corynebacterium caspium DSM 44850]
MATTAPLFPISENSRTSKPVSPTLLHKPSIKNAPIFSAQAPASWMVIGEHCDHFGGVSVVQLLEQQVYVALSLRKDTKVHLKAHFPDGLLKDTATLEKISTQLNEQQPRTDSEGQPISPPFPSGSLAHRLGGIATVMANRQLLRRDRTGFDITVTSDLPLSSGLGVLEAMDAACALALVQPHERDHEVPPLRLKLAESCVQAVNLISAHPAPTARHHAILRSPNIVGTILDFADGSLTHLPHILPPRWQALSVVPAAQTAQNYLDSVAELGKEIRRRHRFLDRACQAFGVDSLRLLPDAPVRVTQWLEAVHQVYGPANIPSLAEASKWLDFWDAETSRAARVVNAVRGLQHHKAMELLAASATSATSNYGLNSAELIAFEKQLKATIGDNAMGVFPTALGATPAAIAFFDSSSAATTAVAKGIDFNTQEVFCPSAAAIKGGANKAADKPDSVLPEQ